MIVTFRNDDVNDLTPELQKVTEILVDRGIPVTHAVEPGNVTGATVEWLLGEKERAGNLIEIAQHGWTHAWHGKGEFGSTRTKDEQIADLQRGRDRLESLFGEDFFPMLTIPYGIYTRDTVEAADSLGYKVFCSHYNYRFSRRLFYRLGHITGTDEFGGHHVSYHLRVHPGTHLFQVDSSLSFIREYLGRDSTDCVWEQPEWLLSEFEKFARRIDVVVFLLHHRYHKDKASLQLVAEVADKLHRREDVTFCNYEQVYEAYAPHLTPGRASRA